MNAADRLDVVGIGLRCVDVVVTLTEMPDWAHGGWVDDFCLQGGGPVGTALVAASMLGVRAGFVGTIGGDEIGRIKRRSLTDYGVDISRAIALQKPENQVAFVYVHAAGGERVFVRNAHMRDYPLTVEQLDRDYITRARLLHLDGFYPEASITAARWMHEAGKEVVMDLEKPRDGTVKPHMRKLVGIADILICGEGGTRALTGIGDLTIATRAVLAMGPRVVVETLGADGSVTTTRDDSFHTPAFRVKVVNTTGAGDVFHGAYLVGLLKGWDARITALFASGAAALTCTSLGGSKRIPSLDAVKTFLARHGISLPRASDAAPSIRK